MCEGGGGGHSPAQELFSVEPPLVVVNGLLGFVLRGRDTAVWWPEPGQWTPRSAVQDAPEQPERQKLRYPGRHE